jgi:hypothetical protein
MPELLCLPLYQGTTGVTYACPVFASVGQPAEANTGNMSLFNPRGNTTMKSSILITAFVACALSGPIVSAQENTTPAKPALSMDMDAKMPQMQESMKKMQQQMDKIRATSDPAERQKLMQEHMQTMQESMKAMHGMGGPMMMDGGQHGATMTGGKKGGMPPSDMKKRDDMMEKRMDMMQMMMEQMIQHDQATTSAPTR